jgi:phosphopentomutase
LTNAAFHARGEGDGVPIITPEQAARNLVALAADYDLLFFESFLTDLAGHGRLNIDLSLVLFNLDRFLAVLLDSLRPRDSLLLTSDHGNMEDTTAPGHTRNPVPLLVVGPTVPCFSRVNDLTGIKDAILSSLAEEEPTV